jgi:hypothetical protein
MLKNGTKKTLNSMPHSGLLIIIKKQNASIITSKTLDGENSTEIMPESNPIKKEVEYPL